MHESGAGFFDLTGLLRYKGGIWRATMAEITIRISDRTLRVAGIVLGGICLAGLVLYLVSSGLFLPKFHLRMYVPEAAGVVVGAPVELDGVNVGRVDAVKLAGVSASNERRIEIVLEIKKRYQDEIRSDSTAALMKEGLLGRGYVSIQRGFNGTPVSDGAELAVIPTREVTFGDVMAAISKIENCMKREATPTPDKTHTTTGAATKPRR
jgi:ABC-type transporter Mla subunit MlaD